MNWLDDRIRRRCQEAIDQVRSEIGLDFIPRSFLNSVQVPAKAISGRSSLSASQTTSFFLVSGFGSGAYSAKLLNGTRQRFSGFSQARQCGEEVLRMWSPAARLFATGHAPAHQQHLASIVCVAYYRSGIVREDTRHGDEVADIPVHHPKQAEDCRLVGRDAVEITHCSNMRLSGFVVECLVGCAAFGHCLDSLEKVSPRCAILDRAECPQQSKYFCGVASELLFCQT